MPRSKLPVFSRFMPDYIADSVPAIDFGQLRASGVRVVALDVDSTLVEYGQILLSDASREHLRESGVKLCLATNRRKRDLAELARSIGADIVQAEGTLRKPRRAYFVKVIKALDCQPSEIAMIGDKLFVDIYGGKRAGMKTVLVKRLGRDSWYERWLPFRLLERIIKRFYRYQ